MFVVEGGRAGREGDGDEEEEEEGLKKFPPFLQIKVLYG